MALTARTATEGQSPATPHKSVGRRKFLSGASGGAAALGFPAISRAQTRVLRFQSTWPSKDIFHEYANDFAKKVNDMSGGRLKIEVLPSGAVVPAFQLLEGVHKGVLDGGHGVLAYHYGKSPALSLWGSGPGFGMDPNMVLAWHRYGGGRALLEEIYKSLHLDVVSFLYGPMPSQALGWFKKPVSKPEDLKGLKYRTAGLSIEMFSSMGVAVHVLPSAEIVPALDRGQIDAAEFNNVTSDRILGFPDVAKVCMLQSFHQVGEQFEVLFNKTRYDALPSELRSIIEYAVQAASADMSWKAIDRYSSDYEDLQHSAGVKFYKTPESILQAQLVAWDKVLARNSAESPMFKKVLSSMQAFARRAAKWQYDNNVDFHMAYQHAFGGSK